MIFTKPASSSNFAPETGGICVSYRAIKIIALSFAARLF
jgi:hypothetical protein